jgi:hypothetical protein
MLIISWQDFCFLLSDEKKDHFPVWSPAGFAYKLAIRVFNIS